MTPQTKKGLIAVGVTLGLVGIVYYLYNKYYNNGGDTNSGNDNFDSLLSNLGTNIKPNKDNIVSVKFNKDKNFAQFYTNNRVVIFDASNNKIVVKGSYSNGGQTIKLDNGKEINGSLVWGNLLETIK